MLCPTDMQTPLHKSNSTKSSGYMNSIIRGRVCLPAAFKPVTRRSCACCGTSDSESREPGVPKSYETWPATAPPPRRLLLGGLAGSAVVLGGNFGGVTTALLGVTQAMAWRM